MKNTLNFLMFAGIILLLVYSSCSKDDVAPLVATSMSLVSGASQSAIIETALGDPVEVIVKDQDGNAFKGATVKFAVAEGSVSAATATTDTDGRATVSWTLGATVGAQTLTVTAFEADGTTPLRGSPFSVTATGEAVPLVATSLELVSGGDQSTELETALKNPVVVIVKDQNGDAFPEASVAFAVAEGAVSLATGTTDANGKISINWTLGPTIGTQTLTITAFKADGTTALAGSPLSVTATATEAALKVGDFHKGGVIFYLDETGEHGLVCAVTELGGYEKATWGCIGILASANGGAVGTGAQNTAIIENECGGSDATWACTHMAFGIDADYYEDYFLPSSGELYLMWEHRDLIDAAAIANGGKAFENDYYWSSTESTIDLSQSLSFNNEGWVFWEKDVENYVRAIRAF